MDNINSDVLNDLDQDANIDEKLILEPQDTNKNKQAVLITAKNELVGDEVTELSEQDLVKLVESDVSFKIVGQKMDKIEELEEVESMLIGQESISKYDARIVLESLSEIHQTKISLEEYTVTRTNTNYQYTLKLLTGEIHNLKDAASKEYIEYMANNLVNVSKMLAYGVDRCTYLSELLEQLTYGHTALLAGMAKDTNKNLVIRYDDSFKHMGRLSLKEVSVDKAGAIEIGQTKQIIDYRVLLGHMVELGKILEHELSSVLVERTVDILEYQDICLNDIGSAIHNGVLKTKVAKLSMWIAELSSEIGATLKIFSESVNIEPIDFIKVREFNDLYGVKVGVQVVTNALNACKLVNSLVVALHMVDQIFIELESL